MPRRVRRKRTHRGAVNFQVITREMCTPGWIKEAMIPDSDVVLFPRKHPCLTTVYAAHVTSGFLCLHDRKSRHQAVRGGERGKNHSTAVGQCPRPPVQLPALWQARHSPFSSFTETHPARSKKVARPPGPVKKKKNRSFSSVTVSLMVEVTVEKQRSAPGSAALELQGSGAPGAPTTFNGFGNPLQAASPFPRSSRNQIACL